MAQTLGVMAQIHKGKFTLNVETLAPGKTNMGT